MAKSYIVNKIIRAYILTDGNFVIREESIPNSVRIDFPQIVAEDLTKNAAADMVIDLSASDPGNKYFAQEIEKS